MSKYKCRVLGVKFKKEIKARSYAEAARLFMEYISETKETLPYRTVYLNGNNIIVVDKNNIKKEFEVEIIETVSFRFKEIKEKRNGH